MTETESSEHKCCLRVEQYEPWQKIGTMSKKADEIHGCVSFAVGRKKQYRLNCNHSWNNMAGCNQGSKKKL